MLAAGLSFLLPPTYEASALVLVVEPAQIVQFDPRFEAVNETRPLPVYPALARSDSLLQLLLSAIGPITSEPATLDDLREALTVSTENDPGLLRLTVRHRGSDTAATIANSWADIFVAQANEVLGDSGGEQLEFYLEKRETARDHLDTAERALARFQETNSASAVGAQLEAAKKLYASYLERDSNTALLQSEIAGLRAMLVAADGPPLPADQLAVLQLYLRAFGDEAGTLPLELQLDATTVAAAERAQLLATLDELAASLQATVGESTGRMDELEPHILVLQAQQQRLTLEAERLQNEVALAREAYMALAHKVTEEEILAQDTSRGLRLASPAVPPERPVFPRPWLNGVLAGIVAFVGLVSVTFLRQWQSA